MISQSTIFLKVHFSKLKCFIEYQINFGTTETGILFISFVEVIKMFFFIVVSFAVSATDFAFFRCWLL